MAEEKTRNEAAAINIWGSKFSQHFADLQSLNSPNEVGLASVPPETTIAGNLEIIKDLEFRICDTGASNHSTFSKVGRSVERPIETQSQGIS